MRKVVSGLSCLRKLKMRIICYGPLFMSPSGRGCSARSCSCVSPRINGVRISRKELLSPKRGGGVRTSHCQAEAAEGRGLRTDGQLFVGLMRRLRGEKVQVVVSNMFGRYNSFGG